MSHQASLEQKAKQLKLILSLDCDVDLNFLELEQRSKTNSAQYNTFFLPPVPILQTTSSHTASWTGLMGMRFLIVKFSWLCTKDKRMASFSQDWKWLFQEKWALENASFIPVLISKGQCLEACLELSADESRPPKVCMNIYTAGGTMKSASYCSSGFLWLNSSSSICVLVYWQYINLWVKW